MLSKIHIALTTTYFYFLFLSRYFEKTLRRLDWTLHLLDSWLSYIFCEKLDCKKVKVQQTKLKKEGKTIKLYWDSIYRILWYDQYQIYTMMKMYQDVPEMYQITILPPICTEKQVFTGSGSDPKWAPLSEISKRLEEARFK